MHTHLLINDVYSHVKPKVCYGKANTKVKIIGDHDNVVVVIDEKGNKFSTQKKNLKQLKLPNP